MKKFGMMERRVRMVSEFEGLVVGHIYEAYEEPKPKVFIKDGPWMGYTKDDPEAETFLTIISDETELEHVPASKFEKVCLKKVRYNGGWGHPDFAYCYGEVHEPLIKGAIYEVLGRKQVETYGPKPMYCYDILCDKEVVEYANSSWFSEIE